MNTDNKSNGLVTASFVLGVINTVFLGICMVLCLFTDLVTLKSLSNKGDTFILNLPFLVYFILNFILSLFAVIEVDKVKKTQSKESCILACALFTISCVLWFSIFSLLSAILMHSAKKNYKRKNIRFICGECGAEVEQGDVFCPHCGGGILTELQGTPVKEKVYLWILITVVTLVSPFILIIGSASETETEIEDTVDKDTSREDDSDTDDKEFKIGIDGDVTREDDTQTGSKGVEDVPLEYKNALKSAESYSEIFNMSKAGIYRQLTSEYGDNFSEESAKYAVDNIKVDFKKNALSSAKSYAETMNMSKDAIFEQLTSEYGEKFTPEEAKYAVDTLFGN